MAQQVELLAAFPEDLSSIPRTHKAEEENRPPHTHTLFSEF